jgi:predicted outer membrane repeat protein
MGWCDGSVLESKFIGNSAEYGGAIAGGDATILDCVFSSNWAAEEGGAVLAGCSDTLTLKNCILSDNSGGSVGGAMLIVCDAVVTISNCTFTGNSPRVPRLLNDWQAQKLPSDSCIAIFAL